jgi:hypothetical protein
MRRVLHLDGLEPEEAADTMVDMDDEIAGSETSRFGQRIS